MNVLMDTPPYREDDSEPSGGMHWVTVPMYTTKAQACAGGELDAENKEKIGSN